jgi:hypothetical protein
VATAAHDVVVDREPPSAARGMIERCGNREKAV